MHVALAKRTSAFSIWTALVVALLYGIIIFLVRPWFLPMLGTNAETYDFCASYVFWTITIGAIPTVLNRLVTSYPNEAMAGAGAELLQQKGTFLKIVDIIHKSEYNGVVIKIMYKYCMSFCRGKTYEMSVLRPREYQSN